MSIITEKENKLFAEWASKRGNDIVKDGVPCPEEYEKAKYKITYVLKEPNDYREPDMDLRSLVYEYGGVWHTWNNITRWTQAILKDCEYPEVITPDDRKSWLRKISFLNLKKKNGGSSSSPAEIAKSAKEDSDLILEQLIIYKPDIIVCCGMDLVADCLADYVFHYKDAWESNRCFYVQLRGKKEKTAVLNCYHPLNLGTKKSCKQLYEDIRNLSKHALANR